MAIYKETYTKSTTNTAAITHGADTAARFPGRMRIRMSDGEMITYGACNCLRIVNKSNKRIRIHFSWGIDNQEYEDMEGNSIKNMNVDDGKKFYGVDIENLDTATDIAIGEINVAMRAVQQTPEK